MNACDMITNSCLHTRVKMKKEEPKEIPVYVFMGFLGSGKTTFAQDTLIKQGFTEGQKTLLLVCEDGEEEYDAAELKKNNIDLEFITDETLNTDHLLEQIGRAHV